MNLNINLNFKPGIRIKSIIMDACSLTSVQCAAKMPGSKNAHYQQDNLYVMESNKVTTGQML
ncbi:MULTISPECIES: hypothetical protein [unclassified Anaerobiospirillum]|uniref:hypothetical protein n=1 Tax=unclassified Anaerobiospirillum TaxID=2647410 RepID=UPI001FF16008|nr:MULTISPECIES: hypothetical protein [unclassified Anaerobiospirillum]MCK0535695.1 hypothetical protein [Anaerobiospirillum sp. NML120511]MCK0540821.1 hypothetical protein [Anaerobiospirillum sp. NML02-A-032]